MKFFVVNMYTDLKISLTILLYTGFWTRQKEVTNILSYCYPFLTFMFMAGISIIVQFVDLLHVWGDVSLMTSSSFLLFTNISFGLKMFNILWKRDEVRAIIEDCDQVLRAVDTSWGHEIVKSGIRKSFLLFSIYTFLANISVFGWAISPEKGELPTRAWYPYNTTSSPGYELTYLHQVSAVLLGASVNASLDTVVISLMAQCTCRLRLLAAALRMLGGDMLVTNMFEAEQERAIREELQRCVQQHRSVLQVAGLLQQYFSTSILAQFSVSLVIICVTAYQLAFVSSNVMTILGMTTYFMCMLMQVFLYCYQAHELSTVSSQVGDAVYESLWYEMSAPLRKDLLVLMVRSQRVIKITAGGFTTLSLNTFMAIIKTSYTLFTVLQRED